MVSRLFQGDRAPRALKGGRLLTFAVLALTQPAWAEDAPDALILPPRDSSVRPARADATAGSPSIAARPRAVARFEGTPKPGSTIRLQATGSTGDDLHYRWIQTRGPAVALDDPARATTQFTVPQTAAGLEFQLVVGNASGVDATALSIPIGGTSTASDDSTPSSSLRADAGDDQVGLVGHLITLNGVRSTPKSKLAYRWLQVGGPTVSSKLQDGYICSFVPQVTGTYRFALVVAADGEISEPDFVDVMVGTPGPSASAALAPRFGAGPGPAGAPLSSVEDLARTALGAIEGGPEVAEPLASAFESVASRIDLYASYADAFREMSLRLDAIVPNDPARRAIWIDRLFTPLTARLVERMRAEGLDLVQPTGPTSPLTANQRAALAELYRLAAQGFRATLPPK